MESVPNEKCVLRLNLDETAVCIHQRSPRGTVCVGRRKARSLSRNVPKYKRKCYMTYVSIICDNEVVQQALPQFLIGNAATLPQRQMRDLSDALTPGVRLMRRKSAWVDKDVMAIILRELRSCLHPFLGACQPIILWDAARQHTAPSVFHAARRLGI